MYSQKSSEREKASSWRQASKQAAVAVQDKDSLDTTWKPFDQQPHFRAAFFLSSSTSAL